jgi:hypothetical protein
MTGRLYRKFKTGGISMRKALLILFYVIILFFSACSRHDRYDDVRAYVNEMAAYQIEYARKMAGSKRAREVAAAIEDYAERMVAFADRGRILQERFPEIRDNNEPDELKPCFDRLRNAADRVSSETAPVFQKYLADPVVLKAIEDLAGRLSSGAPGIRDTPR